MRSLFMLVMTLLVLQLFFPQLAGQLESSLLSVLELIDAIASDFASEGLALGA
jgi:hypothetical protein